MRPETRWTRAGILSVFVAALAAAAPPAAAGDRWLHIRVEESGEKAQTVRVNLPFSLIEGVVPAIRSANIEKGRIKLGEKPCSAADLRGIWDAVRSSEDGEYVTVESIGEKVRVAKSGKWLLIRADESKKESSRVDVKVPLRVVDALLSGASDELDFAAALKALKDEGDCELVAVNDAASVVRIWVDGKNESR